MEHPYYASYGYQVSSYYAVSSRFGLSSPVLFPFPRFPSSAVLTDFPPRPINISQDLSSL